MFLDLVLIADQPERSTMLILNELKDYMLLKNKMKIKKGLVLVLLPFQYQKYWKMHIR